jgi:hypothetical protein
MGTSLVGFSLAGAGPICWPEDGFSSDGLAPPGCGSGLDSAWNWAKQITNGEGVALALGVDQKPEKAAPSFKS